MPENQATLPIDSLWNHKPWWCQPWSILLTGVAVVTFSWVLLKLWWLSLLIACGVVAWWALFLVLVPRAWRASIETERRDP